MNLYALFAGREYYANGGAHDLLDMFDAESDEAAIGKTVALLNDEDWDWAHLVEVLPPEMRYVPLPAPWVA